jgi:hypothetical protein
MTSDVYSELESVLHLLTSDELRLAENLLKATPQEVLDGLPVEDLATLLTAADEWLAGRGFDPGSGGAGSIPLDMPAVLALVPDEAARERLRAAVAEAAA